MPGPQLDKAYLEILQLQIYTFTVSLFQPIIVHVNDNSTELKELSFHLCGRITLINRL